MKFSCEKSIVQEGVLTALRGVSTKSTIPVLEGILINAQAEVSLCGYDLKTGVKCEIPAFVEEKGAVVLNARILSDIIKKLPDELVYIETDKNNLTSIKCGVSVFNIPGLSSEDFPILPVVDKSSVIKIQKNILKSMISQTIFAVSENELKPVHTGTKFVIEKGKLQLVSVDGFRLAIRTEEIKSLKDEEEYTFIVPGSALKEIDHIMYDNEDEICIYPDRKFILFDAGCVTVITRLLEGDFLDYNRAIPTEEAYDYTVSVKELTQSVERVSLIISERLKTPIRCNFEENIVKISSVTSQGRAYDECAIEGTSPGIEIGFNYRYILDALRFCPDEKIVLSLKGSLSPCVMRPLEGDKFLYLVLPVRLKSGE